MIKDNNLISSATFVSVVYTQLAVTDGFNTRTSKSEILGNSIPRWREANPFAKMGYAKPGNNLL